MTLTTRRRPLVMGVVNVTPDSFSDGGRFLDVAAAISHGRALLEAGADILDVGGESTRPGAAPVPAEEEAARVIPVIEVLAKEGARISIDTFKPAVARAAVAAGARIWNDVAALQGLPSDDGEALRTAAELDCEVALMHMQGDPRTMQRNPTYDDVVSDVARFLLGRAQAAMSAGVARGRIWLDPGIGFGKTVEHNLTLLAHLDRIVGLGFPVLLGVSRKRFIRTLDPHPDPADDRVGGSLAGALTGAAAGCAAVRVHDVRQTVQALAVWEAIETAKVSR